MWYKPTEGDVKMESREKDAKWMEKGERKRKEKEDKELRH